MRFDRFFDIVISGAGPAGCSASLFLSKAGVKHVIIDKTEFPRDKICGDALSGKVFSHLKHVIPGIYDNFIASPDIYTPSYGVSFFSPDGQRLDVPFSPGLTINDKSPGFVAKRIHFDHYIYIQASQKTEAITAELIEIHRLEDGLLLMVKVNEKMEYWFTHLLIAADGERSVATQYVNQTHARNFHSYSAGLRVYYSGVSHFHAMNFIELHFIKDFLPGYFWIFPLSNGQANVGVGMLSSEVGKKKINLKTKLDDIIHNHPVISKRFFEAKPEGLIRGWGLPLGRKRIPLTSDYIFLCGDAASLIDPFTGEGVGNAILSGRYAAETAVKALNQRDYSISFLQQYDTLVYDKIGSELKLSSTLLTLCKYPWLFNMVVKKANTNPELKTMISGMFADIDLRNKFSNPLFYLKILLK